MEQLTTLPIVPGISRLLANQWAETLRQTACLEVLVENQARLLAHLTGQETESLLRQSQEQVAVAFHRLLQHYGHGEALSPDPPMPEATPHPLSDEVI